MSKFWNKYYTMGLIALTALIVTFSTVGVNDNGYRTVVQWPTGTTFVKMDAGVYFLLFGKSTTYPDVVSHDLEGNGISVRYQDGGKGTVDGIVRVALPTDEDSMLKLHKAVRTESGLRNKLLYPEVRQSLNLTAGLMTSEEAYAVRRNDFASWASDQIQRGRYDTVMENKEVVMQDGTKQNKQVPVIKVLDDGSVSHQESPIQNYGMKVLGFQITDWSFEPKTEQQISRKREAEMAIITARANADKAVWEQKEIAANGEKEVERVRYEQLRLKEQATIQAEREKQVAVINAQRQAEVNEQQLDAATVDVQTAKQEALALKTRKDAEAYGKKALLLADNALAQKLEAEIKIQEVWAKAFATRKVPQTVFGAEGGSSGGDTDVKAFMQMMTVQAAKQLNYDRAVNAK